jgi:hypothetical protein
VNGRLRAPAAVKDVAADLARETAGRVDDPRVANVLVAGTRELAEGPIEDTDDGIEREDGEYHGPASGALGRLAAAVAAIEGQTGACLHYPDPVAAAPGPWLVVEPLGGRLATVAKGRTTVTVELERPTGHLDARLRAGRDRLDSVIEAARPRHQHYPVERDELGTFTRGLVEFELEHIATDDGFTVTLGALTVPRSGPDRLRDRFRDVEGVESVDVSVETEVEHAEPSTRLRQAVEDAAAAVVGDWSYEWLPAPTAFGSVSSDDRMALGTGDPSDDRFDREAFETGRDLLTEAIGNLGGDRS